MKKEQSSQGINSAKGNKKWNKPASRTRYRFFSPFVAEVDAQRLPTIKAIKELGHSASAVVFHYNYEIIKYLEKNRPDVVILFGNSLLNLMFMDKGPLFLNEIDIPFITFWDDNPLRYLHYLRELNTPNHLGLFVIDNETVNQLHSIGFTQARYLPLWYTDPKIFFPSKVGDNYRHTIAFAGTIYPYEYEHEQRKYIRFNHTTNQIANEFIRIRQNSKKYVDVFDYLINTELDKFSLEFSLLSNALMFEQKAIERKQLIDSLTDFNIDVYGETHRSVNCKNLTLHGKVLKEELSRVYSNSKINLCCTQWPTACHQRVFQAAASRSFILHESKKDVESLFSPGNEIVLYESLEELPELINYYLKHDASREKIADAAYRRFLAEHQPKDRITKIFECL